MGGSGATPQQGGMGLGGGGLGSTLATGMALGVGSGIGHAAAGAALGALSGGGDDDGAGMEYYDDGSYNQQDAFDDHQQHPCMRYWEKFQNCMNQNSDDIGGCQAFYNVFNQCQAQPDA